MDHIESERHADLLAKEVEHLRDLAPFRAVAVNSVGIACCRDDLKAKASDAHSQDRCDPNGVVLEAKAVDEEARRDEDLACPNSLQANFRFWIPSPKLTSLVLYDGVEDQSRTELTQRAPDREGRAVGEPDVESVPVKELLEDAGDCHRGQDRGESVL